MNDTFQNVRAGGRAYLVEEQPNPSTDYYVQPALICAGLNVVKCGFRDLPSPAELEGAVLVFVRYVPSSWRRLVDAVRPRLAALVFFMDDDVLDTQASVGMPLHYRLKLARLAGWKVNWLRGHGAELWVSVAYLTQKYSEWEPRLVLPSRISSPLDGCRVFYHGSSTHRAEVCWLRPVIEEVLRRDERISFEIVGGREVFKLYRGLRSVTTVHPMKWPAYQDFIAMGGRHIGLAPLLDVAFNQARSYTKFFDFTRCGSVGVYSKDSAYAEVVEHGVNGLLLPLDQQAWVEAILGLASDGASRDAMLRNAEASVIVWDRAAQSSYADLRGGRECGQDAINADMLEGACERLSQVETSPLPAKPERKPASWIAMSRTVASMPELEELLGAPVVYRWAVQKLSACSGVVAWGRKPSATAAVAFAARHGLRLLRLEDGFLRSVELGHREAPLSIVLDDVGIYYDAAAPSRLEMLIVAPRTQIQLSRAQALIQAWRSARVSKYNHAREYAGDLSGRYVLVVDQVRGDESIRHGAADEASFQRMVEAALTENPGCDVLIKVPPAVVAGHGRGHFDVSALKEESRIKWLTKDMHPASLIEHAEAVYVVTSQLGFEGLLWGKRVRVFGMPFYAGWGLSDDELAPPPRRTKRSLTNLVHAALIDYPRYIDPETGRRCEVERVLDWMALQLRMRGRFPPVVYAQGFSLYKRPIVRAFFQGSEVHFVRRLNQLPKEAVLAVWSRADRGLSAEGVRLIRLEDGFIRSVGLGADLVRPLSWVMDYQGIYYDATVPSALETLLSSATFDETLLGRARILRERLVSEGVTKYNVGAAGWTRPCTGAQRVILVPGQVESDASLAYGALGIRRNLDLLCAVREKNPDAYLVYKPHPDVVAGLRREGLGEGDAARYCDEIVTEVGMGELLLSVDEVHTLTSLTGFEALLRGKVVVCYGLPFYAGWGVTTDMLPIARRVRKLSMEQLVAGALIMYPSYVSSTTGRFTTPERVMDELVLRRTNAVSTVPWWGKVYRFLTKRILRRR